MGSLGGAEILLIFVLALLLFGPRSLPRLGRTLARGLAEFRKATHELRTSLEHEVEMEEIREVQSDLSAAGREFSRSINEVRSVVTAAPAEPGRDRSSGAEAAREPTSDVEKDEQS